VTHLFVVSVQFHLMFTLDTTSYSRYSSHISEYLTDVLLQETISTDSIPNLTILHIILRK